MTLTQIESTDDLLIVSLAGSLDMAGAKEIESTLLTQLGGKEQSVILVLSEVSFLASFGMRLLIEAHKILNRAGRPLILLSPQTTVERVLIAAGMDNIATIAHSEEEARSLAKNI